MLPSTAQLLEVTARRVNCPAFIEADPVQFPRSFARLQDVEVTALLTATIAWGNRPLILRDCRRLLARLTPSPYLHVREGDLEAWGNENVHRTFFASDVAYYLKGLRRIYLRHESLNAFFKAHGAEDAWDVAALLGEELSKANDNRPNPKCIPLGHEGSALKRLNLALRWMVRRDGVVDLGLWDFITEAELFVPLDVHVQRTARSLGLLSRKSIDRKACEQLTAELRSLRPHDPVYYDFALFGLGVEGGKAKSEC